mmetsp:Transcript_5212/g.19503  ORF Transcript_5212/g.19503 Transcript_5212/m.19503 type:complete len:161 (-) Transcript_5212:2255-2737(-)
MIPTNMTLKIFQQDTLGSSVPNGSNKRSRPQRPTEIHIPNDELSSNTEPSAARSHAGQRAKARNDSSPASAPPPGTSTTQKQSSHPPEGIDAHPVVVDKDVVTRRRRGSIMRPIVNRTPVSQALQIKEILNNPGFKKKRRHHADQPTSPASADDASNPRD